MQKNRDDARLSSNVGVDIIHMGSRMTASRCCRNHSQDFFSPSTGGYISGIRAAGRVTSR